MIPEEHRPRLNRLERLFTHYPLYFVTACTEERRPILANPRMHESFRQFCDTGLTRGVFVGNYVLMPDHLHLFVVLSEEYVQARAAALAERRHSGAPVAAVGDRRLLPLSDWVKSLKNSLSKTLRAMNIPAPHWQKGLFDHVLRSEESYSEKWLYVVENPVRKGFVTQANEWPFHGESYPLAAQGHV
jgi:REP element-mobilizing transposase RayT